jgi:hypothetical protein
MIFLPGDEVTGISMGTGSLVKLGALIHSLSFPLHHPDVKWEKAL